MVSKIGFIGAGNMGGAVARRLAGGGHDVHVYDLSPAAVQSCEQAGAVAAGSASAAVHDADVVFTSLPMPEHVLATWTRLAPELAEGAIAVDVSTIDPGTVELATAAVGEHGHPFVTCALGKTPAAAERGEIPLFVGGPGDAVSALRPLFERIGEATHRFESAGAAAMFKLISNLVGMTNVAVLAEGYVLARAAGITPEQFGAALADTGAASFQSQVRLPWLMAGDYEARFGVELAAKDVRLALDAGARQGIPSPVAAQGLAQLLSAVAHGYGGQDAVAVAKVLDPDGKLLGTTDD
ncbi:NAD(P)-dependent oxidoreductase [Prauserella cavernicola]|uniref:NAD(P)-dependent oxidoreductase n=1 Tax=Prauserella cavernicola TaxID=2800127 RepID=A0A934QNV1_9PSEU|nr:NAD(P)-dependent oxidoreductase [Prauserella cavernicola]MBK1783660.1 NAD(P)-dependent oxidoreductase [Prauserella cavernicola]